MARRTIRELAEAVGAREPLLLDERLRAHHALGLDRLVAEVNHLVEAHRQATRAGSGIHAEIQAMLGNLREAVVLTGTGGGILSANESYLQLVGIEQLEESSRLDSQIGGAAFREFLGQLGQAGGSHRRELEVQIGKASRWLEISAAAVQTESPAEPKMLFVLHDITRQKRLEQMRTEFVANVSHEVRTPVTVIKGYADTLVEDEAVLGREDRLRFLDKIRSNAERLDALVGDLLLLARLESAEMVLHRERLSLAGLVRELAENWRPAVEEGGRRLELDFTPGDDAVLVDPLRMTQVVNNLIENCVRHARGFTELRIRTRREGGNLQLDFADNGCGIPDQDLPHVFQRFYRVDKGRSRESGGTGLGLSIVKHIILQHGGRIQAFSEKGRGTRIGVVLPAAESTRPVAPAGPGSPV